MVVIDTQEWITAAEAAQRLGRSSQSLYELAQARGWQSVKIGRERLYQVADVEAVRKAPPKRGRPRKTDVKD